MMYNWCIMTHDYFVSKIDIYKSSFLSVFTRNFFLGPVLEEEKVDVQLILMTNANFMGAKWMSFK